VQVRDTIEIDRKLVSAARAVESESVAGKRVLITGSTRGIGRALATAFARRDALVVVHGRGESDVRSWISRVRARPRTACMVLPSICPRRVRAVR
jgi:NAD(P)-dependent dehydrogenase (short-subunit alcohol dehydrogenase family)